MDTLDFVNLDQSSSVEAKPYNYSFLYSLNLNKDVIRRLSLHLDRIVSGSNEVFLTPIGKDNDPSVILKDFDKIFESNLTKMNKPLRDLESFNRDKYGPRSIAKPWSERKQSLVDYFGFGEKLNLRSSFRGSNQLRPISLESSFNLLKNTTNSGLPYYTQKRKVKEMALSDYEHIYESKFPCILFTRTQEGNKTRNVWGYPIADTVKEQQYYYPLLSFQKKLSWRSALIGPNAVDKAVTSMVLQSGTSGLQLLSVDFSSYDSTVKYELQKLSFDYIKSLYQPSCSKDLDSIADRFATIGIITPDGVMSGQHGVPSGSTFTNEVDSIAQYLVSSQVIGDTPFQIQGDDELYCLSEAKVNSLKDEFIRCGLQFNESKSSLAKDYAIYLQKLYHKEYCSNGLIGGIYPVYRALCRIVFQERYSDFEDFGLLGVDYYSIRTISILENCKYHPLFRNLVEYVYKLDKYSLKFSNSSVSKYDRMLNLGKGAGAVVTNQFGDVVSGINSFETVKLIRELAK
jgi:hypothetical protein